MAGDARTDQELVGEVLRGEWRAFDVLYGRYADWAYGLAWRFCGDGEDAADAVQEVFVYLAKKLGEGGFELRAEMKTFLWPAVKHSALALKRKRRRMGALPEEEGMMPAAKEAGAEVVKVREELAAVMAGLSEAHREVVLMRFVDEMTLEEIAGALKVPVGTVKSRLHHAIADLREDARARRWFGED